MPTPQQNREFVQLWTAHSNRVFAYVLTLLPNKADAEEALQEIAVALWEKFDDFQPGTNFRAWANAYAFNFVRNFRRRKAHQPLLFSDHFLAEVDHHYAAQTATLDQQSVALADCLARLAEKDRHLLQQRYEQGESVKALAQSSGRTADAVYKTLRRIHGALFECIGGRAVNSGAPGGPS